MWCWKWNRRPAADRYGASRTDNRWHTGRIQILLCLCCVRALCVCEDGACDFPTADALANSAEGSGPLRFGCRAFGLEFGTSALWVQSFFACVGFLVWIGWWIDAFIHMSHYKCTELYVFTRKLWKCNNLLSVKLIPWEITVISLFFLIIWCLTWDMNEFQCMFRKIMHFVYSIENWRFAKSWL